MTFLGHVPMDSGGEGMAEKLGPGGRRLFYVAHEAAPGCFDVVDVTDARNPKLLQHVMAPVPGLSCNSLDVAGNLLAVAGEVHAQGERGAGVRIWSVADPAHPRLITTFDTSGPYSRGTHHVWFSSPTTLQLATGFRDFRSKRPGRDERFYMAVDLTNPAQPKEIGR